MTASMVITSAALTGAALVMAAAKFSKLRKSRHCKPLKYSKEPCTHHFQSVARAEELVGSIVGHGWVE